ncbi:MAG: aldehyde reductase, partial [Williamsia sp.]|nr:aldehyde reductase [Williamsia sp.]
MTDTNTKVLVTGGSGFIAVHCIVKLLQQGCTVRTTLRSLNRAEEVKEMLRNGGVTSFEALSFTEADLTSDANWREAAAGCDYVLHVASPTPIVKFVHEDEMINPAREGVLRVLKAAKEAGVTRVVLTSAFGAIGVGHKNRQTPYTEADWTDLNADIHPYQKSKTLAEKAAWNYIQTEGGGMELSTVNPVAVMGPVLGTDYSHSHQMIKQMLEGDMKACPRIASCYVDVRDVADLHLLAMTDPKAAGERFLATAGNALSMLEVATILKRRLGDNARKVPTKELPDWQLKGAALANPTLK